MPCLCSEALFGFSHVYIPAKRVVSTLQEQTVWPRGSLSPLVYSLNEELKLISAGNRPSISKAETDAEQNGVWQCECYPTGGCAYMRASLEGFTETD